MKKRRQTVLWINFCLALLFTSPHYLQGAEPPAPRKIRVAFTSLSGSQAPPWIAREAGIFRKHGLEVEVIAMPSGVEGMNALIAGEVQFLQIAGGTTVSAALGGADVIVIATTIGTFVQNLVARPEIEKAEQLRGKSVGISRFGTSIDTGARLALRHFGLEPEKDVAIVQMGAIESIVPAMQGNQVEAVARMKRDKNFTMGVMGKYLRTSDPELLSESYEIYAQKYLMKVPLPTVEAVKSVLEELADRNPKAKDQDPKRFFDDSFVRQLETGGFINNLYR